MSKMSAKYLVTGAAGNLGRHIVNILDKKGADIRGLVLPDEKYIPNSLFNHEIYKGNILNNEDLLRFFTVSDDSEIIVIHCAGIVSIGWDYNKKVYSVNVDGTKNIVEQCIKTKVRKLIYVSSVHAIPELPHGQTMSEVTDFNPDKVIGFYGKTKAKASRIVMEAVETNGLNASLVFPSGICGPEDYTYGNITQLLIEIANGRLIAGVQGGYSFVDVRDVADAIVNCCENGEKGNGYILSNRYVSIKEIFELVHAAAGQENKACMLPICLAELGLPFIGAYCKLTKTSPLFTKYSLYTLRSNPSFSSEKAKKNLNFTPRPFSETIFDSIEWLTSMKIIKKKDDLKKIS